MLVEILAGGLIVGIAAATRKISERTLLSSEELLDQIILEQSAGFSQERVAGFIIDGTKQLVGNTLKRSILYINKPASMRNFKDFARLLGEFEAEAARHGVTELKILGYSVVNNKLGLLLANPKFAERYGLIIRQINDEVVEITKKL